MRCTFITIVLHSVVVVGLFAFKDFYEVGQIGVSFFLTIRLHFIFCSSPFVEFTTRIHLFNRKQDLVLIIDRLLNCLAQFLVFVQVATKCDDVLFFHPRLVEICSRVGFFFGG